MEPSKKIARWADVVETIKRIYEKLNKKVENLTGLSVKKLSPGEYGPSGTPTIAGEENILYFVPSDTGSDNDVYDEWMYIDSEWEHIGTTAVDLTELKKELESIVDGKLENLETTMTAYQLKLLLGEFGYTSTPPSGNDQVLIKQLEPDGYTYKFASVAGGFVPTYPGSETKFLNGQAQWVEVKTDIPVFDSVNKGLVPAPGFTGEEIAKDFFLTVDGWRVPTTDGFIKYYQPTVELEELPTIREDNVNKWENNICNYKGTLYINLHTGSGDYGYEWVPFINIEAITEDEVDEMFGIVSPKDAYVYLYNGNTLHFSNTPIEDHGNNTLSNQFFVEKYQTFAQGNQMPWVGVRKNIVKITTNGDFVPPQDISHFFLYMTSLTDISGLSTWNTSAVTNMESLFDNCSKLVDISPLSGWDTSSVTNMSSLFTTCTLLEDSTPLLNWNTSNVIDMNRLFSYDSKLKNVNGLQNWVTSSVENMSSMFISCTTVSTFEPIYNWDVSNVKTYTSCFSNVTASRPSWASTAWA